MKTAARAMILALFALTLAACDDDAETVKPRAQEVTGEAIGYYCNMVVAEHMGPKGQIHLKDGSAPLWFSSVRDVIAFTMLPEESKQIAAIYVNDMTEGNWDSPEPGSWIDAWSAWYVVGSTKVGGMGAPETVPFSKQEAAQQFAAKYGGEVMAFDAIPEDFVLGGVETPEGNMQHTTSDMSSSSGHMQEQDHTSEQGHTQ